MITCLIKFKASFYESLIKRRDSCGDFGIHDTSGALQPIAKAFCPHSAATVYMRLHDVVESRMFDEGRIALNRNCRRSYGNHQIRIVTLTCKVQRCRLSEHGSELSRLVEFIGYKNDNPQKLVLFIMCYLWYLEY